MAALSNRFNPTEHDTTQREGFTDLDNGIYVLQIIESDVLPTSAGTGEYLKTKSEVLEPASHKGQTIQSIYNLVNPSAVAQKIGNDQFSALCRAIGEMGEVSNSVVLHNRSYTAKVGKGKASVGKDGKKYDPRAEIKVVYFPDEGNVPVAAIDENQPAAAPVAANNNQPAARPAIKWGQRA